MRDRCLDRNTSPAGLPGANGIQEEPPHICRAPKFPRCPPGMLPPPPGISGTGPSGPAHLWKARNKGEYWVKVEWGPVSAGTSSSPPLPGFEPPQSRALGSKLTPCPCQGSPCPSAPLLPSAPRIDLRILHPAFQSSTPSLPKSRTRTAVDSSGVLQPVPESGRGTAGTALAECVARVRKDQACLASPGTGTGHRRSGCRADLSKASHSSGHKAVPTIGRQHPCGERPGPLSTCCPNKNPSEGQLRIRSCQRRDRRGASPSHSLLLSPALQCKAGAPTGAPLLVVQPTSPVQSGVLRHRGQRTEVRARPESPPVCSSYEVTLASHCSALGPSFPTHWIKVHSALSPPHCEAGPLPWHCQPCAWGMPKD